MALDEAGVQLIAQGVAAYVSDINKADSSTTGFYKTLGESGKPAGAFQEVITGALRHVGVALVEFAAQGAKAIGGFVKDSIGLAGEFESGMLNFQAVAGKEVDASGLEDFRDLFLDIGKRLPVSTSEVQQAATEMVKGGIDPAIIAAGGLERNIQFAAAAMDGDLVKAAEISAKVLGGWSELNATAAEKTDFLSHATDLLSKAANASATDVEGLSLGIFNAQGTARNAGVSFDDLTTSLAALAPRFESSAIAGNSLKNFITRLQPTTKPATEAMQALGLYTEESGSAFYDAQGNFIGFQAAAQLLKESLEGLTPEMRANQLQAIFQSDAMGAAAGLAELGAEGYQQMADALANANGVMDTAALKQAGFETSLDNAKGSVEALQITIGSALLPVMSELLDGVIAPAVNTLTDLASALLGDEEAFNKLSPAMKDVANEIKGFIDNVGAGVVIVQDIAAEIQSLIGEFNKGGQASAALEDKVEDLNGVWNTALSVIENVMDGYMAIAQAVLPVITAFIAEHGDEIAAFFQSTWDTIIEIVTLALQVYDKIVPPILNTIAEFINDHGSEIQKILSGAWDMITSIITGALETIKGVFKIALALLNGDWDGAWEELLKVGQAQMTAIQGAIEGFLNLIAGIFDTSLADIAQIWTDNWNMLVNIVDKIGWWEAGQSIILGIKKGLDDAWAGLITWFGNKAGELYDWFMQKIKGGSPAMVFVPAGMSIIEGIMLGISNSMAPLLNGVSTVASNIANTFEDGDLVGVLESLGEDIMGGFIDGMKDAWRGVENVINSTADKVEDAFRDATKTESPSRMMMPIGQGIVQGIMYGLENEWPAMVNLIGNISADLISEMEDIGQAMNNALAEGFGATSSIDRQMAKNLDDISKIEDAFTQKIVSQDLDTLLKKSQQLFADPKAQADYFKMVSGHEFELLKIRQQLAEATDEADKDRLNKQLILISRAQDAELDQFYSKQQGATSPIQDVANQINDIIMALSGMDLTEDQIKIVDLLASIYNRAAYPTQTPTNPAYTGATSYNQSTTLNMPIYSNNSPSALRDSMAIAGAALL